MEKSDSIKALAKALSKFQNEVGVIPKNSTNPYFNSKYADLSDILTAIKKPLHAAGLSISQFPTGEHTLTTILMHESGEFISSAYSMTPKKDDPQGIGSAITYQRRYALGAVLGLNIDEDDDANAASGKDTKSKAKAKKPESLAEALKCVASSNTIEELVACWNDKKTLHANAKFTKAMTDRKKAILEKESAAKTQSETLEQ